jgi:hypothetical protein
MASQWRIAVLDDGDELASWSKEVLCGHMLLGEVFFN